MLSIHVYEPGMGVCVWGGALGGYEAGDLSSVVN